MVDLQSHKLQLHPSLNVNPVYDNTNGNNGTNLITKHNSLVDALETNLTVKEINLNKLNKSVFNYPTTIPSDEWTNTINVYVDSVNGNDTNGNGTELNPYKTITKAIEYVATKKIVRNITNCYFFVKGTFSEGIDFSSVIVDITKDNLGVLLPESQREHIVIFSFRPWTYNGIRQYTITSVPIDTIGNTVLAPTFIHSFPKGYKNKYVEFWVSFASGNFIADTDPFSIINSENTVDTRVYFSGCNFTNTSNNGWADIYLEKLTDIQILNDFNNSDLANIFTTVDAQWAAIELNNCVQSTIYNCTFTGYDETIVFDTFSKNYNAVINNTFDSVSNDIWIDDLGQKLQFDGNTASKGIRARKAINIPLFFNGNFPTGTIFLNTFDTLSSLKKIITKCGTGSFTFDLQLNTNTVSLSSNSADTNKNEHSLTGLRVANAGTDINLINVTGTATNVTIILVFEFIG